MAPDEGTAADGAAETVALNLELVTALRRLLMTAGPFADRPRRTSPWIPRHPRCAIYGVSSEATLSAACKRTSCSVTRNRSAQAVSAASRPPSRRPALRDRLPQEQPERLPRAWSAERRACKTSAAVSGAVLIGHRRCAGKAPSRWRLSIGAAVPPVPGR